MAIKLTEPEDLEKVLTEHNEKIGRIEDIDSQMGDFTKSLKEIQASIADISRRPFASDDGSRLKLPVTKDDWAKFGVASLHKAPTAIKRVEAGRWGDPEGAVAEFQDASDRLVMIATMLGAIDGQGNMHRESVTRLRFYRQVYRPALEKMFAITKEAFDTADAGAGLEWVPTTYSQRLVEKVRLEYRVAALFEELNMPSSPFVLPTFLNDLTAFKFAENTATAGTGTAMADGLGSTTVTGKVTFTAVSLAMQVGWSWELEEDSIIAMQPFLERAVVFGIRNGIETAILNGDSDGTHQDTDIQAVGATHAAWAWDGLRKTALANDAKVDHAGGTLDTDAKWFDTVGAVRGLMNKYGVISNRIGLILSPKVFNAIKENPSFRTQYAFGMQASNTSGDYGNFRPDGLDLVVSEFQRDDTDGTGINGASGNTKSVIILVYKGAWMLGTVRQIRTQVLREAFAVYGQNAIVASWRGDFKPILPASEDHTGIVYDIAP